MLWLPLCLHRPWPACTSLARVGLHTIPLQQSPPPHALQVAARWPWSGHSGHPRDPRLWCHTVLWDMVTVSAAAQAEPSRGKPACIACGPYSLHVYSRAAGLLCHGPEASLAVPYHGKSPSQHQSVTFNRTGIAERFFHLMLLSLYNFV